MTPYLTDNADFYRVDTALQVPDVPVEGWTLRIHGMVDKELELTYDDLLDRDLVEKRITLTCVSNPVGRRLPRQRHLARRPDARAARRGRRRSTARTP